MSLEQLIQNLQLIRFGLGGDLPVVTGLAITGYGSPITKASVTHGVTADGSTIKVVNLDFSDEALIGF